MPYKKILACGASLAAIIGATLAHAVDTYGWNTPSNVGYASGMFTVADLLSPTIGEVPITFTGNYSLVKNYPILGLVSGMADNMVFDTPTYLDSSGLEFNTALGDYFEQNDNGVDVLTTPRLKGAAPINVTLLSTGSNVSDYRFAPNIAAVPEPASWALMLIGFGLIGGFVRNRRHGISEGVGSLH